MKPTRIYTKCASNLFMDVKEEILRQESIAADFREKIKQMNLTEDSSSDKLIVYNEIYQKTKSSINAVKIRLFFLGLTNKPLAKRLHVVFDLMLKAHDFLADEKNLLEMHKSGTDEDNLEFGIVVKQLIKKIKELDSEIIEKMKTLKNLEQKKALNDLGDMLMIRYSASIFCMLDMPSNSTAQFIKKLVNNNNVLSIESKRNPLNRKNRHNPVNYIYPF